MDSPVSDSFISDPSCGGGLGLDAVQPMRSGWYIYIRTQFDRDQLIQKGIIVAGKYVALRSEAMARQCDAVKVTLKDLPLNSVSNEHVLESLKEICLVESEVSYSNVWFEGKPTMI